MLPIDPDQPPADPSVGADPADLGPDDLTAEMVDASPATSRRRKLLWISGVAVGLVVVALVSSAFIRIPYYTVSPGGVRETESRITVDGAETYESEGEIDFLTVSLRPATVLEAFIGWLDPTVDIRSEEEVLGTNDPEENRQVNMRMMTDSKQIASYVALNELGEDVAVFGTGALIVQVEEDLPVSDLLVAGETVVAVDGEPITRSDELVAAIRAHAPGDVVTLTVEPTEPPGGDARDVEVELVERPDEAGVAMLGVASVTRDERYEFPYTVNVDSGNVGGPSAGLAFTLGIIDRLSPGSLTNGLKVAVTGTISPDGSVGLVGGVPQKVAAARQAGADLMLVPSDELEEAQKFAGDLRVEPVGTVDDALSVLAGLGGGLTGDASEQAQDSSAGD